jgi:DNA topoisomerase-1
MNKTRLQAVERVLLEPGYRRVYQPVEAAPPIQAAQAKLATLRVGERVRPRAVKVERQVEQLPAMTEAALIRALQIQGIGRPATYADTIVGLLAHEYATRGKGGALTVTSRGQAVCRVLVDKFPQLFALDFTARLEAQLDQVAAGKLSYNALLASFWGQLAGLVGEKVTQLKPKTTIPPVGEKYPRPDASGKE